MKRRSWRGRDGDRRKKEQAEENPYLYHETMSVSQKQKRVILYIVHDCHRIELFFYVGGKNIYLSLHTQTH